MNFSKKGIAVAMFLALVGTFANAQNNNFSVMPTLGVSTPILDGGVGFHIGVNPSLSLHEYFAAEGQVSYNYTKITSGFLNGDTGTAYSANFLLGPRIYFTPEGAKVRPYINALVGGLYYNEAADRVDSDSEFGLGFSGGGFVKIDRFVVGLSYETLGDIVLKVGYTF